MEDAPLKRVATWFKSSMRKSRHGESKESLLGETDFKDDGEAYYPDAEEFIIHLSRNESGLGLVFDSDNVVTKLHPGCAAAKHGGVRPGDRLLAVDGFELQPGDRVGALFPMHVTTFELRLLRSKVPPQPNMAAADLDLIGAVDRPPKKKHLHHDQRVAQRPEQSGKFEPNRPAPVFQEVIWNEYCVLFPDGSSAPFNEEVRYTALTGYLRKKPVVTDGRAEFALLHGESERGWARHFCHLSMKQLAWFDEDPQLAMQRHESAKASGSFTAKLKEFATNFKLDHSSGKSVGSALLYAAPCRLYVSRLHRNEFALSFGGNSLLLLQAASGADAQEWVVAIAACLFFSSAAFEAVLAECRRFFDAAYKTIDGRLSPVEALDLVRAMGRECRYSQVVEAAYKVGPEGGWFGIREFTYLVRSVCSDADPRSELLRAFKLLAVEGEKGGARGGGTTSASSESGTETATDQPAQEGHVRVTDLVTAMYKAGVPDDHVRMVLRATGADVSDDYIPYVQLADALYPAAATAAKRKRMQHLAAEELRAEADAREAWEKMREELLRAAGIDGRIGPAPTLIAVRGSAAPGTTGPMYGAPGTARALSFQDGLALNLAAGSPAAAGTPKVPPLGLSRAASAAPGMELTPRRAEIVRSMNAPAAEVATPRTIADRVQRARRASEVSKAKKEAAMAEQAARRLSGISPDWDASPMNSPRNSNAGGKAPIDFAARRASREKAYEPPPAGRSSGISPDWDATPMNSPRS